MEKYSQMTQRHQEEFNALPIAFAFNNEQFAEALDHLGACTSELHDLPGGGFCKKADYPKIVEMMERHQKEIMGAIAADETGEGFIFSMFDYELSNREYCVTQDVLETLEALGLELEEVSSNPALTHGLTLAIDRQEAAYS